MERYCVDCYHYDPEHQWCQQWQRHFSPAFRMTTEHDCPHFLDLFDWAETHIAPYLAQLQQTEERLKQAKRKIHLK